MAEPGSRRPAHTHGHVHERPAVTFQFTEETQGKCAAILAGDSPSSRHGKAPLSFFRATRMSPDLQACSGTEDPEGLCCRMASDPELALLLMGG